MSEMEKAEILEKLVLLPEADKAFMLGYAAGRTAAAPSEPEKPDKGETASA